jgi:hypothetical protein
MIVASVTAMIGGIVEATPASSLRESPLQLILSLYEHLV